MSGTSDAKSKWVANIRLSCIRNDEIGSPDVETTSKSFWASDIEAIEGEWPVQPEPVEVSEEDRKAYEVLKQAVASSLQIRSLELPQEKCKRLEERLKVFPRILFRDGSSYHIENKSDYDRLMKLLQEG